MKLKELTIKLQPCYAKNAGQYESEIEYEGEHGSVKMNLDPKVSDALLLCIGEVITRFATAAAERVRESMIQSVCEAQNPKAIEQ